jgi:hypothetical protein
MQSILNEPESDAWPQIAPLLDNTRTTDSNEQQQIIQARQMKHSQCNVPAWISIGEALIDGLPRQIPNGLNK